MLRFVKRSGAQPPLLPGIPPWLGQLLAARGVDTKEKADLFLNPSPAQLHDPFLMAGMDIAVPLIRRAIAQGQPIVVYGDYDVDGVCAASICLMALRSMGAKVDDYIPSRHEEGYGLNEAAVRELAKAHHVLITVDCGITSLREVALAKELGMGVVVTDHHQPGEALPPADAVLNPLLGGYPFPRLCGAGVALKLMQALLGPKALAEYVDLAALATIADIVPLVEENRVIAAWGLSRMEKTRRPGLRALMEVAGIRGPVKAGQVAFGLAPRLNAGGRLKTADMGVELLTTQEEARARELAQALDGENALRQRLEAQALTQALAMVESEVDFLTDRALVVAGESWNSGVIGLVAGRLAERYHYPAVALTRAGEDWVGSARSIPGINIHHMLTACGDLLIRFGGHQQAAGLTVSHENLPAFQRRLSDVIRESCDPEAFIPRREYDLALPLHQVTEGMIAALAAMQPTGFGNPEPVFLLENAQVQDMRPVGREGAHLKCTVYQDGSLRSAIAFQMGALARDMPGKVDALFTPELNEWNGTASVQCSLKALRPAGGIVPPAGADEALEAVLKEIRGMRANIGKVPPTLAGEDELALALAGAQGTLVAARSPETARRILASYGDKLDAVRQITDRRSFHTLLYPFCLSQLQDVWHTVILADGELFPGEASQVSALCKRARVLAFPRSQALAALMGNLAPSDEAMRRLYKAVREDVGLPLASLARLAGLGEAQAKAGLYILGELDLIAFQEEPFLLSMRPPIKRSLQDSQLLRAIQTLAE